MIPRQFRLKHDTDFDILFKEGRFVRGQYVSAKVWKIDPARYPRRAYTDNTLLIGFVVSKKIDKRAVGRNRIKRRMREAVRLSMKEKVWNTGFLVAFIANPQATEASFDAIAQDMLQLAKKARLRP